MEKFDSSEEKKKSYFAGTTAMKKTSTEIINSEGSPNFGV